MRIENLLNPVFWIDTGLHLLGHIYETFVCHITYSINWDTDEPSCGLGDF